MSLVDLFKNDNNGWLEKLELARINEITINVFVHTSCKTISFCANALGLFNYFL